MAKGIYGAGKFNATQLPEHTKTMRSPRPTEVIRAEQRPRYDHAKACAEFAAWSPPTKSAQRLRQETSAEPTVTMRGPRQRGVAPAAGGSRKVGGAKMSLTRIFG